MERIYIIEDDDNIRNMIKIALESFGYAVHTFETAEEALNNMENDQPDLAIFDIMLPGMDGLTAVRKLRTSKTGKQMPVIMLTAKDTELDKVTGLDIGADDYMTKPFGIMELSARIRSLLRRSVSGKKKNIIELSEIKINTDTREVYYQEKLLELTFKEYELLKYLIDNNSRVVPREELISKVWGYDYEGETRTLDMHIRFLRQKLGENGNEYIKTVRGVGYRFNNT